MAGYVGRQGRKPKPTALKLLTGNPGKRAINEDEPKPKAKMPACPEQLQGEARKEWHRMGKKLHALGLVTEIDKAALTVYCQAWGRWAEAEVNLQKYGPVIFSKAGIPIQSPYMSIANRALELMMKALVEFGMSPSSRSRVKVDKPEEVDEFEQLMKAGRA